ncbi:MAG: hypothetical protein ACO1TE_14330, partial [Prosthecobacter sp.]
LSTGTKTESPVSFTIAKRIYDRLVAEKTAKGYRPGDDAGPMQLVSSKVHTGIHCQLLNPLEDDRLNEVLLDPAYWMQEKLDGRRLLLKKDGDQITSINRLGFPASVPESIVHSAQRHKGSFLLDGEAVGDVAATFCVKRGPST